MYNGIGLSTARGSGTNGYVQRNMSFVHKSKEKVNYKTEEDIKKLDALSNRKPNQGILAHEKKRYIELKCLEMQELMEDEGYPPDVISTKVGLFREMLQEKNGGGENEIPKDEFGRPLVKESHQLAEANQEKNSKMRNALGISHFFVEGSSLDPERRNKEAAAAAAEEAKKKYTLIPDSSDSSPERSQEKDKKRKKKKSPSNNEKEQPSKKKKSVKKHKKDRSESPNVNQKKKKSKKTGKEKIKHKSKSDSSRKKHARSSSSSSSSSSSDSDNDESNSSRSSSKDSNSESDSSQDKHRSSLKQGKSHKVTRKRSTSSERIRYAKDARSRKDIYEAKKAKYKKKTRSSSSSSTESPPRQYYRLEPVLVKSKSKHNKAPCQIFEIPKKSALELMKYERKKRKYQSSSSSDEESAKLSGKRRKHSESPIPAKPSKHASGRDLDSSSKQKEPHKSRRSEKVQSPLPEKHSKRSRSNNSQHKSESHKRSNYQDYSVNQKQKDRSSRNEERHHESEKSKKKHRRDAESPRHQNGYSRQVVKPQSPDSDGTERRSRSCSPEKRKSYNRRAQSPNKTSGKPKEKFLPRSPSSPPPDSLMRIPRSPSHSPPRKSVSKHHRSQKSSADSPLCKSKRHDSRSRSRSPIMSHKITKSKRTKEDRQSRNSSNENSESVSRSPSMKRSSHARPKHQSKEAETFSGKNDGKGWKSNMEVKDVKYKGSSGSPDHYKKRDKEQPDYSPTTKTGMNVRVETCQITSTKSPVNSTRQKDSPSHSPERSSFTEIKVLKQNDSKSRTKDIADKTSSAHSNDGYCSPLADKQSAKSIHENNEASSDDKHEKATFVAKKSNWSVVSSGEITKNSVSQDYSKNQSKIKHIEMEDEIDKEVLKDFDAKSKRKKIPDLNPSRSRSTSGNHDLESSNKNKVEKNRSRSRSTSLARSASHSGSERSSRSRSYSQRDSKSRSRSKSYSKSRSRSQSRSKSRSHSKSYSRSRSPSAYSRSNSGSSSSRSRSRSNERSRSIPRRRGSPSFLDKRRITS